MRGSLSWRGISSFSRLAGSSLRSCFLRLFGSSRSRRLGHLLHALSWLLRLGLRLYSSQSLCLILSHCLSLRLHLSRLGCWCLSRTIIEENINNEAVAILLGRVGSGLSLSS